MLVVAVTASAQEHVSAANGLESSAGGQKREDALTSVIYQIAESTGWDVQDVGEVHIVDDQIVMANISLWPTKYSNWFLIDLERRRVSDPIAAGYGTVLGSIEDLSGNSWYVLHSTVDRSGPNLEIYEALMIQRASNRDLKVSSLNLVSFYLPDSIEELCLDAPPAMELRIDGQVRMPTIEDANRGGVTVSWRYVNCTTGARGMHLRRLVPSHIGFQDKDLSSAAITVLSPSWDRGWSAPAKQRR